LAHFLSRLRSLGLGCRLQVRGNSLGTT
jgi:hypothetical protein